MTSHLASLAMAGFAIVLVFTAVAQPVTADPHRRPDDDSERNAAVRAQDLPTAQGMHAPTTPALRETVAFDASPRRSGDGPPTPTR